MRVPAPAIVGLFPSLDSLGGVQVSGREAWQGIVSRIGEERAAALFYEPGTSKAKAAFLAFHKGRHAGVVLVWHLQLLKLLPFLEHSRSRVVVFLHGVEAWLKHDAVTRFLLRNVDLFLSNSEHTWTRFLKSNPAFHGTPHRIVHLGSGASLRADTPLPSDPPAVLMIGRLDRREDYKGHRQMIEAWPLVLERAPTAQLWIVGGGNLQTSLEDLARQRATCDSVKFFGRVSDAEKERLLARCRCFAMPSRGEGFGLAYLEAMRMGRPCLVGNADAGREVVNPPEAGLAVNPDDSLDVADAINRMLTAGCEWETWSARARSRYEANFTGDRFRQRFAAALFDT